MTTVIAVRYVIAFFLAMHLLLCAFFAIGFFTMVTGFDLLLTWRP